MANVEVLASPGRCDVELDRGELVAVVRRSSSQCQEEQPWSMFSLQLFGSSGLQILATPRTKIYFDAGLSAVVNEKMMSVLPYTYQVVRAIMPIRVLVAFLV